MNGDNNHVWNGSNERLKNNKPPPPIRKQIENLSFIEKMDDRSGAVLFVQDPNNNNGESYQCKFGKIDFSRSKTNCNSIEVLFDQNASIFKELNWKENFIKGCLFYDVIAKSEI